VTCEYAVEGVQDELGAGVAPLFAKLVDQREVVVGDPERNHRHTSPSVRRSRITRYGRSQRSSPPVIRTSARCSLTVIRTSARSKVPPPVRPPGRTRNGRPTREPSDRSQARTPRVSRPDATAQPPHGGQRPGGPSQPAPSPRTPRSLVQHPNQALRSHESIGPGKAGTQTPPGPPAATQAPILASQSQLSDLPHAQPTMARRGWGTPGMYPQGEVEI